MSILARAGNRLARYGGSGRLSYAQVGHESGGLAGAARGVSDPARAREWSSADLFRQRGQLAEAEKCARRRSQLLRTRERQCASRTARTERARDRALREIEKPCRRFYWCEKRGPNRVYAWHHRERQSGRASVGRKISSRRGCHFAHRDGAPQQSC